MDVQFLLDERLKKKHYKLHFKRFKDFKTLLDMFDLLQTRETSCKNIINGTLSTWYLKRAPISFFHQEQ